MGTATKLYLNWSPVTVTPSGGSLMTLTNITRIDPAIDASHEPFYGDARAFAIAIAVTQQVRGITITGGDIWKLLSIPTDTPCTIVATLNDLYNGVSTGAITFTLVNAVRKGVDPNAENNKIGSASVSFMAFSVDGSTDPLSVVQAT